MDIEIDVVVPAKIKAKFIRLYVKARDIGSYTLLDEDNKNIAEINDYVPNDVIPGEYGDYIDLKIDLETGVIVNWKKPTAKAIKDEFFKNEDE